MALLTVEPGDLATCKYCLSTTVCWQVSKLGRNYLAQATLITEGDDAGKYQVDTFAVHNCRKVEPTAPLVGTDQDYRLYVVESDTKPEVCLVLAYSANHAKVLAQLEFGPAKRTAQAIKPKVGVVWRPL